MYMYVAESKWFSITDTLTNIQVGFDSIFQNWVNYLPHLFCWIGMNSSHPYVIDLTLYLAQFLYGFISCR